MKKSVLKQGCMLAVALAGYTAVTAQQKNLKVTGNITGLTGKVYLANYTGEKPVLDSVITNNGIFAFEKPLQDADFFVLQFPGDRARLSLFTEPGVTTAVTGSSDSLNHLQVAGGPAQKQYEQWKNVWGTITATAGTLYRKSDAAEKEKDTTVKAQLKAEVKEGFAALDQTLYLAVDSFVKAYPASPVSAYIIYERFVGYPYPENAAKQYAQLSPAAKASLYGRKIEESRKIDARTAIGVKPQFTQPDTLGKLVKVSDFKGKYVLIDFWASWCGPCRKENPNVVAAYKKYHDKGFEILSVSLDDKKEAWLNAVHKDGLTWTHVSDLKGWKNEAATAFGVKSVPTSLLLDKNGVVVARNLRGEELHTTLEKLLK